MKDALGAELKGSIALGVGAVSGDTGAAAMSDE